MSESPGHHDPLRVMVIEDSKATLVSLMSALDQIPDVAAVGSAITGMQALERLEQLKPDIVTVDMGLPDIDGVQLIRKISALAPEVIMLVITAMEPGRVAGYLRELDGEPVEFLNKPARNMSFADWVDGPFSRYINRAMRQARPSRRATDSVPAGPAQRHVGAVNHSTGFTGGALDLIIVGSSTGGPGAVNSFLSGLSPSCGAPVLIAQHMPKTFTPIFADQLDRRTEWTVREACPGVVPRPGEVWLCPGDRHLTLGGSEGEWRMYLDDRPELFGCRPAVDFLFGSVAESFTGRVVAVVLTGMGCDGMEGCRQLLESTHADVSIACQDRDSAAVWGMPAAVTEAGYAHLTGPPELLGEEITRAGQRGPSFRLVQSG